MADRGTHMPQPSSLCDHVDSEAMCACGHTAHWHTEHDDIPCEGVNFVAPGSFVGCDCVGFSERAALRLV